MSVHAIGLVWRWDLPPAQKLIMLYLAKEADDDGSHACYCVGASAAIAASCGFPTGVVTRSLNRLLAKGCIFVSNKSVHNQHRPAEYAVDLEWRGGND